MRIAGLLLLLAIVVFAVVAYRFISPKSDAQILEAFEGEKHQPHLRLVDFKGKKILIVNVASKCGYTPQYEALQELYMQHSDKLVVVGFPCDQFMGQELNSESEIRSFCTNEFQITIL